MRWQVHGKAGSGAVCISRRISTGIKRSKYSYIELPRAQISTKKLDHYRVNQQYVQDVIRKHFGDRGYILLAPEPVGQP